MSVNQGDLCQSPGLCRKITPVVVPGQVCSDAINLASRKGIRLGRGWGTKGPDSQERRSCGWGSAALQNSPGKLRMLTLL